MTLFKPFDVLARALPNVTGVVAHSPGIAFGRVGQIASAFPNARVVASPIVQTMRLREYPEEIALHREAARISLASIEAAAERMAQVPGVEAIFISCTSLRVAEAVAELERRIGIPVTSSNHAMAWHCLRLAGIYDVVPAGGRLFALPAG